MEYAADIKFAKLHMDFRDICPFYYSVYRAMEVVETKEIDTMGVTTDKFYYNKSFVDSLTYPEFLFVVAHEMCHVALLHVLRMQGREHRLANIACDMYVNKFVMEDIAPKYYSQTGMKLVMPSGNGIEPIYDPDVNIHTDTVESIYDRLCKEAQSNGYFDDQNNKSDHSGNHDDRNDSNDENDNNYIFHQKKGGSFSVNKDEPGDILSESEKDGLEKERQLRRILTRAIAESEQIGGESSLLSRSVENFLKSNMDWRKWLLKYCILAKSTDVTFSNPDKRMFYTGNAIYPGQSLDETNELRNVKVCIDTSGSINDKDLQYFLGHILRLTKQYRVSAEVIAWDTKMTVVGRLTTNTSLADIKQVGDRLRGGGDTNPSCLFSYFDSKKCREKPIVTLIFTDGHIAFTDNAKWKKRYKDTLWILPPNGKRDFQPPFGKAAKVTYD